MDAGWIVRAVGVALVALLAAAPACATEPLRSIAEIREVPILEADDGRPVVVRGVVTMAGGITVIQDGDDGIFVVGAVEPEPAAGESAPRPLVPGALVEIEATAMIESA
jgi:hypothetical protein